MKFKDGILNQLVITGESHILLRQPMTPSMITALNLRETIPGPGIFADAEFGWSGLQVLCCQESVKDLLLSKNAGPYAMEGIGYISFSSKLFDDFDKDGAKNLSKDELLAITNLVSQVVGVTVNPKPVEGDIIVTQLEPTEMNFTHDAIGYQVRVIVPVEEGAWLGTFQIHTQELQAAKDFYGRLNKVTSPEKEIAATLSSDRTLN